MADPQQSTPLQLANVVSTLALSDVRKMVGKDQVVEWKAAGGQNLLLSAIQRSGELADEAPEICRHLVEMAAVDANQADTKWKQTPLFHAARSASVEWVRLLIELRADTCHVDVNGQTPLFYAAVEGYPMSVKELLLQRADPMHKDNNLQTALFYAAKAKRSPCECVNALLDAMDCNAPAPFKDVHDRTPLFYAAKADNAEGCTTLLAGRCEVDAVDQFGQSALFFASSSGSNKALTILLEANAAIDLQDNASRTALLWALTKQQMETCKLLVSNGANPALANVKGQSPLSLLLGEHAKSNSADNVAAFVNALDNRKSLNIEAPSQPPHAKKARKSVMQVPGEGELALVAVTSPTCSHSELDAATDETHPEPEDKKQEQLQDLGQTIVTGSVDQVRTLLREGLDANEKDADGRTALFVAAHAGRADVMRALLDGRADPSLADRINQTPLFHAAWKSHECVALLLEARASASSLDARGQTPIFYAARYGIDDAIRHLVEAKANVTLTDTTGKSPLDYARLESRASTAKMLVEEYGATSSACNVLVAVESGQETGSSLVRRGRKPASISQTQAHGVPRKGLIPTYPLAAVGHRPVTRSRTRRTEIETVSTGANAGQSRIEEAPKKRAGLTRGAQRGAAIVPRLSSRAAPSGVKTGSDGAAVEAWMRQHGLGEYAAGLERGGYDDLSLLAQLSEREMEEMLDVSQVVKPGHRVKFKHALRALMSTGAA
eukprot:TRINITY_DN5477_c0_g2_i1.p1 TRINITY_DN5477_c0_g2~~TRINITY_DN5477_c0_g2_i1.p1  ORF type:complete len:725 (-),score=115.44 TRINITY_DN5477_c0_g2_i1:634-2808(-)